MSASILRVLRTPDLLILWKGFAAMSPARVRFLVLMFLFGAAVSMWDPKSEMEMASMPDSGSGLANEKCLELYRLWLDAVLVDGPKYSVPVGYVSDASCIWR